MKTIRKRDGSTVIFDQNKIANAMMQAFLATGELGSLPLSEIVDTCNGYAKAITNTLAIEQGEADTSLEKTVAIEDVQDAVETFMMRLHPETAKAYILYRESRRQDRDINSRLMQTLEDIALKDAKDSDVKRENANINGNTPMGTMLKFGSESAKTLYASRFLTKEAAKSHNDGDIHIHDLDFLTLTTTCCEIDLTKLFSGGFSTGHGYIREPNSIMSYAALAAIAIQANQNDQHGGQGIPFFDYDMAPGVAKTLRKEFSRLLTEGLSFVYGYSNVEGDDIDGAVKKLLSKYNICLTSLGDSAFLDALSSDISYCFMVDDSETLYRIVSWSAKRAIALTDKATHQAMESFIHNLNTMHSRAGAQVPFSSINYGTDTSLEGRMVVRNILLATMEGLGFGETPIFPIQVFRIKKGVNYSHEDPNYDLFEMACECSAKRMFPNFSFQDAPFNLKYYNPHDYNTQIAYMGCRTRVIANVYDTDYEKTTGRGNLSFTSINLPRLAIDAVRLSPDDPLSYFRAKLDKQMELVVRQLIERYQVIAQKKVYNFPFLMGQGVWHESEKLKPTETVGEVLKHGTLTIGFIGIAETLTALTGKHHGESDEAQELGLSIVQQMREFCDKKTQEMGLNFSLIATPAEGLSGRFVSIDRRIYGVIDGVTDKDFYTNSFHIPVGFEINIYDKIRIEAPYHEFTNAGHITYIELDGTPINNPEAFKSIVSFACEAGLGYFAINHPIDRDPACGFNGIIGNECPKCGRADDDGNMPFERIRRITGYLVGGLDRFNNAKRIEESQRIKHG